MEDNPDLDLDPTMWIPVPRMPESLPADLPEKVAAVVKEFRRNESEAALQAAAARRAPQGAG